MEVAILGFHFTCHNHSVDMCYRSVSIGKRNHRLPAACWWVYCCGHNMTKDLYSGVISFLGGAQGQSTQRGKEKGEGKDLVMLSGLFLSLSY